MLRGRDPGTTLRPWLHITAVCAFSTTDTFEYVSAMVSRSAMQTIPVVIYRPGNMAVSDNFFELFADLLERVTNYSSVLLVGDVNIHLDDDMSTDTIKFNEILDAHNFTQHVPCSTHVGDHILDVFLTRQSPSYVWWLDVLPPGGLSNHSMITGSAVGCDDTVTRCARSLRSFDLDAFLHDLIQSVLVLSNCSQSITVH